MTTSVGIQAISAVNSHIVITWVWALAVNSFRRNVTIWRFSTISVQAAAGIITSGMPASELTTDEDVGVDVCADMDVGKGCGQIGRMMSAERRLRKGVDSIVRRMYRRRRDVGKGTPTLGLCDKRNARTSTSWPMLSLRMRRSHERTDSVTRRIHKRRRRRDSHTWTGPVHDHDEGQ